MKKVLIITYYWPPAGGPGVQRVLKFAKYLPEFGWQPIILTVQNGEYPAYDESLFSDIPDECKVYKTPAVEPFALYKKFTGMRADEAIPVATLTEKKTNWKKKLAHWIRLNLFIPDAKIGWIPYAVKAGKHIIRNEKPDIIFSSSPPPTVHLIARSLARWSRIKWVADFRDPWTEIYHQDLINKNKLASHIDVIFEEKILTNSNEVLAVSRNIAESFQKKAKNSTITVITNGYDDADFKNISQKKFDKFTIAYAGKINHQQNPEILWKTCAEIIKEKHEFKNKFNILLMGKITNSVHSSMQKYNLIEYISDHGYVDHQTVLQNLQRSTILLLLIPNTRRNEGIVTGKLFEYLAMNNFILGFGPENGDAAHILNTTNSGKMFEYSEEDKVKNLILELFLKWTKNAILPSNSIHIAQFSRRNLTEKLVGVFGALHES